MSPPMTTQAANSAPIFAAVGVRPQARPLGELLIEMRALQAEALVGLVRHFHAGAESDEFAEAFELCDCGAQPDKKELKRLFPFY